MTDEFFIQKALLLAKKAERNQEVPIGAVLIKNNVIIGEGFNHPIGLIDPTAHAELLAIREATKNLGNYRLTGTVLYVTLEPCLMCFGAIIQARIQRLVFGAYRPRSKKIISSFQLLNNSLINRYLSWKGGMLEDKCAFLLKKFFRERR
ncbi:tRNA adenosine(34) deaminase TadA [Coxiella endosymbiont of Amblyomma americanum]|uniref:tRNA adenosine(34) deaminase TadA n=1 Tax=Coxiella endosymbiont of Amblyomma americanum TaxID=325775 RepID=UPI00057DAD8E|nr:tRNA adenosine(34) deaminase TadA [Coxiella endosymbiont of Amblyomma americanum]AJC50312.1 zinc-binding protein [Coxiella endosymbiont of Amblyomma americanum]AUJ58661.1 tRNA-specific adenosine deaminase [Coxiella-like endosymbiont of Amblyomma americanum]